MAICEVLLLVVCLWRLSAALSRPALQSTTFTTLQVRIGVRTLVAEGHVARTAAKGIYSILNKGIRQMHVSGSMASD